MNVTRKLLLLFYDVGDSGGTATFDLSVMIKAKMHATYYVTSPCITPPDIYTILRV